MNREERVLNHNKADVAKIVTRKPSGSEGAEGDIAIGHTANGTSLFAKIGNKWYEFSSNESFGEKELRVKGSISYIHGAWGDAGTSNTFLPMNGSSVKSDSIDNTDVAINTMLLPFDCRVLSIMLRSDIALGSTSMYLWDSPSGGIIDSSDTSTRGELSPTINMSSAQTSYLFQFSGEYTIPARSNLAVQIFPNGGAGITGSFTANFAMVLDYDIPV